MAWAPREQGGREGRWGGEGGEGGEGEMATLDLEMIMIGAQEGNML